MAIKGIILPNRIPNNKYRLEFLPDAKAPVFVAISGIGTELDSTDLPDGTSRSGGRQKPSEFDVSLPAHHDINGDFSFMETWWLLCENTLPGYLKIGVLTLFDEYGFPRRIRNLENCWIYKREEGDLELESEGTMHVITYSIKIDSADTVL